jgi:hypothetical protein
VLLVGVCVVILGVLYEAVASVSRKPRWHVERPVMTVVHTVERRMQSLPFVAADRRKSNVLTSPEQQEDNDVKAA